MQMVENGDHKCTSKSGTQEGDEKPVSEADIVQSKALLVLL